MSGNLLRRVAIASATSLLIGLLAAAPASAIVPPSEGGASTCQARDAGYSPAAAGNVSDWEFDGRLRWDLCVTRNTNGTVAGWARLSSPSPEVIGPTFDRFTGLAYVYLQRCTTKGYVTIAETVWEVSNYAYGSLSGNWYRFSWRQTPSVSSSGSTFRVKTVSFGAVVPRNGGWYFSMGESEYPGFDDQGNPIYGIRTSGCITL